MLILPFTLDPSPRRFFWSPKHWNVVVIACPKFQYGSKRKGNTKGKNNCRLTPHVGLCFKKNNSDFCYILLGSRKKVRKSVSEKSGGGENPRCLWHFSSSSNRFLSIQLLHGKFARSDDRTDG